MDYNSWFCIRGCSFYVVFCFGLLIENSTKRIKGEKMMEKTDSKCMCVQ